MKKLFFLLIAFATVGIAMAQPPNVPAEKGAFFGKKFLFKDAVNVDGLKQKMNEKVNADKTVPVTVRGVVSNVCTKEGCWIKLQSETGDMMVKMKDHSFLVPVALKGKTVVVNGTAKQKITTVEQLKHYAEDAGKPQSEIDAITEDKKEVILDATGLLVL